MSVSTKIGGSMSTQSLTGFRGGVASRGCVFRVGLWIAVLVAVSGIAALPLSMAAQNDGPVTDVYADDPLSVIQAAVDAGGVVYFNPTNRDGSDGVYLWDAALRVPSSVTLTGPPPVGYRDVSAGLDDRTWGVHIVRQNCYLRPPYTGLFVTSTSEQDSVLIENLSIETDCNGITQIPLPDGRVPSAPVPGADLEIRDCSVVVSGINASPTDPTAGNRAIRSMFVANARLIVTGSYVEAAATPESGIRYSGDNDAIFSALSTHSRVEIRDNIAVCDSWTTGAVSAAMEVYLEHDPTSFILIADNYLEAQASLNIRTEAPVRVLANVIYGAGGLIGMNIVNVDGGLIEDNVLVGSAWTGARLANVKNTRYLANDSSALVASRHLSLDRTSSGNLVRNNALGPVRLTPPDSPRNAALVVDGTDNRLSYNDCAATGAPGWWAPDNTGCVLFNAGSSENAVSVPEELLPAGTTICRQILDLGSNSAFGWSQLCR
jgi:hypothetical protein